MNFSIYGLIIGLAFLLGWWIWEKNLQSAGRRLTSKQLNWAMILAAFGALAGGRLYHVLTDWPLYQDNLAAAGQVWLGGLGIYGALAGGLAGLAVWHKYQRPPRTWSQIADAAALALPWTQALGRWGNFVNQELFGPPTNLPWGIFIDPIKRPVQWVEFDRFHPLFLYESLASLALGGFLFYIFRRFRKILPLGSYFYSGMYLFSYATIRFSLEFLRTSAASGWGPLTIAQWVSGLGVVIGVLLLPRSFRLQ